MKQFLFFLITLGPITLTYSQDYNLAIGYRAVDGQGFTVKSFIDPSKALEGIISFRNRGMQITGLYEFHEAAFTDRTSGFYWLYGFGPHIGFNRHKHYPDVDPTYVENWSTNSFYRSHLSLGLNIIGGLEYRLLALPLTLGIEYKPTIELADCRTMLAGFGEFGFSIKYRIK